MAILLVPVKDQVLAKSRLSGVLAPDERRSLNHAMLQDVLDVVSACPGVDRIVLVSDDPTATLLASKYSAELFSERDANARNVNEALGAASAALAVRRVGSIAIVPSDMPLLNVADLEALLQRGADTGCDLVLGPDLRNDGTNALVFATGKRPTMLYGPNSFSRFQEDARQRGLKYTVVRRPGIGQDVDIAADVLAVFSIRNSASCGRHTAEFLCRPKIVERLSLHLEAGLDVAGGQSMAAND